MRKYWGQKAIIENNVLVALDEVETFNQVGEMQDGSKVYEDKNGEQYIRTKTYGQFVFYHI